MKIIESCVKCLYYYLISKLGNKTRIKVVHKKCKFFYNVRGDLYYQYKKVLLPSGIRMIYIYSGIKQKDHLDNLYSGRYQPPLLR